MAAKDTLSAVLNGCFLEVLKVFAVLLAGHERKPTQKAVGQSGGTLPVLSKYSQYVVCVLWPVCL